MSRPCDCWPTVGEDGTVYHRLLCASLPTREERLTDQRERCGRGYHEDPDNSGLCIHCSAEL